MRSPVEGRDPSLSVGLPALLFSACVVVPCLFTTRLHAVFVVPKLAALWAILALGLLLVAVGSMRSSRHRSLSAVDVAIGLFLALNLAAWLFSIDRRQSLYGERLQYQGLLTTLLYAGYFYLARVSIADVRRLRLLLCGVAAGAGLVAAYALVQRAGLDPIWDGFLPGGRVFSSIGQSNALAAYLVLALALSSVLIFDGRIWIRAPALAAVGAMMLALMFTFSRGGYLGFLAAGAVLAVGWRPELSMRAKRVACAAAALLVAGVAATALVQPAGATGVESFRRVVSRSDESVRIHTSAWRVAAQIAMEHPLLGTGQETFPEVLPGYSHAVLSTDRAAALDAYRVESPHNVFLGVAAGSGIPALLAYLGVLAAFVVATLRATRCAERDTRLLLVAALAGVVGHTVTDCFMTAELTSTWLTWLAMGAVLGVVSTRTVVLRAAV